MASWICDNDEIHPDPEHPIQAEFLVTRIEDGDTAAWCGPCYLALSTAIVRAAEAQQPQPETVEDDGEPGDDDSDEDAAAVERLVGLRNAGEHSIVMPDGTVLAPGEVWDQPAVITPAATRTVRRGTSRSRVAFEERKRAKAAPAEDAQPAD